MPVRLNRMKQKLRQGESIFGGLLRTPEMATAARKGIPVSVSVRGIEEVRDALKRALAWPA